MDPRYSSGLPATYAAWLGVVATGISLPRVGARTKPLRPLVAAFGEWSTSNLGDRAIHEGVQRFFAEQGWEVESFDFGRLRRSSVRQLGVVSQLAGTINVNVRYPSVIKRELRGFRQRVSIARLLPQLNRCDAICVGGGALLADSNLHFPQSLSAIAWAARVLGKPLLCVGCSAEGEWSRRGRHMVRDFAALCDFIAVRDQRSATLLSDLLSRQVPVFGDFALPLDRHSRSNREPQYGIALNVNQLSAPWRRYQEQYETTVVELVRRMASPPPWKILVFTTGTQEDTPAAKRVANALSELAVELYPGGDLERLQGLIAASQVVIAARLHAAIIALAQGVPALGFSVSPKILNFFESLGIGHNSFQLSDPLASEKAAHLLSDRKALESQLHALALAPLSRTRSVIAGYLLPLGSGIKSREAV